MLSNFPDFYSLAEPEAQVTFSSEPPHAQSPNLPPMFL
jgi:hypothetical protein